MKRQFQAAIVLSITIAFLTCLEQTKGEALADAHEPETGFSLKVESIPVGDFSKNPKSKMLVYDGRLFPFFKIPPEGGYRYVDRTGRQDELVDVLGFVIWQFLGQRIGTREDIGPLHQIVSRGEPKVLDNDSYAEGIWAAWRLRDNGPFHENIGPQLSLGGISGYFHRFAGKPERVNEQNGSEGSEAYLPPCGVYLPLSGYSPFPSSVSSLALGGQIVGLVLIGFCFAFLAVFGFYWVFDDPNRNRVFRGAGLAATGTVGCLFFYGWAFSAHPLATWGLC